MKKDYEDLSEDIYFTKAAKYTIYLDNKREQEKKKDFVRRLLLILPNAFLSILFVLTNNILFLYSISQFILIYSGLKAMINIFKRFQIESSKKKEYKESKIINLNEIQEMFINNLLKIDETDYLKIDHTQTEKRTDDEDSIKYQQTAMKQRKNKNTELEKYNKALNRQLTKRTHDQEKYALALDKQLARKRSDEKKKYEKALKNLKIRQKEKENQKLSIKAEAIREIFIEIRIHKQIYNIPPILINQNEWYRFFDTIYDLLKEKERVDEFYYTVRYIIRYVLAKSLVNNSYSITLQDLIENIHYLDAQDFTKEEIDEIKFSLNQLVPKEKVLQFSLTRK